MNKEKIKKYLLKNKPILLFDSENREGETDVVFYPENLTHDEIRFLRKEGGGLICVALSEEHSDSLGLPFIMDLIPPTLFKLKIKKTPYGDKPAFSISINHSDTFTGITDEDRANTITSFFQIAREKNQKKFLSNFYSPGHVFLLRADESRNRKGHTEISTALLKKLDLIPVAVLCEMLDSNGKALSKEKAKKFAEKNKFLFLETKDVDNL